MRAGSLPDIIPGREDDTRSAFDRDSQCSKSGVPPAHSIDIEMIGIEGIIDPSIASHQGARGAADRAR
jgi:hypothetical protein